MKRKTLAFQTLVLLAGCSNILGIHDPSHQIDGGSSSPDSSVPIDGSSSFDAHQADAVPPDASQPDAFVATACAIRLTPRPTVRDLPLPVLNAADDTDTTAGMQITVVVSSTTSPAAINGQLFVDGAGQASMQLNAVTGGIGTANVWPATLTDGQHEVFARCTDASGTQHDSNKQDFIVDTTPPTCAFAAPTGGALVSPSSDSDLTTQNIDLTVSATIGGGDSDGETITFAAGSATSPGTIAAGGAQAVLSAPVDGPLVLTIATRDKAWNPCAATETVNVDYGCDVFGAPAAIPAAPDAVTGQLSGPLVLDASACASASYSCTTLQAGSVGSPISIQTSTFPSDRVDSCTVTATDAQGVTTVSPVFLQVDGLGDAVVAPVGPYTCGATLSSAADIDPGTTGVQIAVDVDAADPTPPTLLVNGADAGAPSGSTFTITLAPGANTLVGTVGSTTSAACALTLGSNSISITGPTDGAVLGTQAGTVDSGGLLDTFVTGWEADPTQPVTISIGGVAVGSPHVYPDGHFELPVALAEGAYTITATTGSDTSTVHIAVDVTPPDPITDFVASRKDRRHIALDWTQPAATTCTLRQSPNAFNLATAAIIDPAGQTPLASTNAIRLGAYGFRVLCADAAGNSSSATTTFTLDFVEGPTWTTTGVLPLAAFGDANGDGATDIAVASNGGQSLLVFHGDGKGAFSASPDLTITDSVSTASFPTSAVFMDYDHDGKADLVIGSMTDAGEGAVYVLLNNRLSASAIDVGVTHDVMFSVDGSTADTFWKPCCGQLAQVGTQVMPIDFDGDGTPELYIGGIGLNAGKGGGMIIFGSPTGNVLFPTTATYPMFRIRPNGGGGGKGVGIVANLGPVGDVASDTMEDLGVTSSSGGSGALYYGRAAPPNGSTDITVSSRTLAGSQLVVGSIDPLAAGDQRAIVQVNPPTFTSPVSNQRLNFFNENVCAPAEEGGGDIDGDGPDDTVCVGFSNRFDVYWGAFAQGNKNNPDFTSALTPITNPTVDLWTPDVDGDGLSDLVVISANSVQLIY